MHITDLLGWILYIGIILYAISGIVAIRDAAKTGKSVTLTGQCLWAFSITIAVVFAAGEIHKSHILWITPLGVVISFTPAGMAIGRFVGTITAMVFGAGDSEVPPGGGGDNADKHRLDRSKVKSLAVKRKATPAEVAAELLRMALKLDTANEFAPNLMKGDDFQRIQKEVIYLQAFAADYFTQKILGDTPVKNAILDAYYALWEEIPEKERNSVVFYEEFKDRLVEYTIAVNQQHANGPTYTVGKAFSELCGFDLDAGIIFKGGLIFSSTNVWVIGFYEDIAKEFEIVV